MKTKLHYLTLCFCLVVSTLQAQIAYHGFEQNAADTWGATFSTPACNVSGDVWDYSTALGGIVPSVGTQFWAVQDLTGNCGSAAGETITFADVNVSAFTGVSINFDYNIVGFDAGDDVFYTLILDGVPQTQVQLVTGNANFSTGGYITETINIPNGTNTVGLILLVDQNGGSDRAGFDNFILDGTLVAACPHTITNVTPISGSVGTEVTIQGTGFTATSTVTFNGIAASNVQFVDATTIVATVPTGSTTGSIVVTEAACTVTAATGYTLLDQGGVCGVIFSDLIISEVFDNNGGSLGYIELYNGTGATIDLTNYQIDRYGNLVGGAITHSYNFPATGVGSSIADGQVLVARINSGGSGVEDFDFGTTAAGFNADDRLELMFTPTNTLVDDFHDAVVGAVGFLYRRNTTITGPNPAFTASEWTTGTSGDESDLGLFNIIAGGTPTITTQPVDISGCGVNLSVIATAGNGGTLTYQWFFNENDGNLATWTAVSGAAFAGTTVTGATTATLSITGNLTSYNGYQFYCQVSENGACNVVSEAVQFTLAAERFFRTIATGDWTTANTWEMATSAAGPWSPTCVYPLFDNSDYIHILSGHTVSVDQDIVVDEVVIETGGTVSINNNRQFEFNNGTGIDLDVQGTLIDNGNSINDGLNLTTSTATWILGTNGEFIKTGSSPITQYRDNYEGGIATIPATATWRFRQSGNSGIIPVLSINMFYPNLYLESTSGNHSFNTISEIFQGNTGFVTIKGSLYVGNSGTGSIEGFNTNTNASLMQVLGDLVIGGNGSAGISKMANNQSGTVGTGIEVHGNLRIENNGQLDFEDGTATADGLLRLHGNWTDLNPGNGFDEGESTVEFIGTTTQTIDKATISEAFHNVVVNKTSGNLQNNASDMVIENDMTFTNGIVLTTATSYLLFEAAATATNAFTFSHVDGPVIKETNTGSLTTFTYPTGDNGVYGAIGIETRFNTGEFYIAEYFLAGYGTYNVNAAELDHVSSLEYWTLDEGVGGSGENLRVTLHWGAHSNVLSPASIRVGHFYTEAPSPVDQWEREGASPPFTGTVAAGTVTSDYVTTFSPFTLADVISQASLPLEILRFDATKVEQTALLEWEVANEKAGDRYCLERSTDAQDFETLVCFDATNDNATALYNYVDAAPFVGYNYYRIHQIDVAGISSYSATKVVEFKDNKGWVLVYPNPAKNQLTIELPLLLKGTYEVTIIDVLGRQLISSKVEEGQTIHQLNTEKLATGTYLLRMLAPNGSVYTRKITIRH